MNGWLLSVLLIIWTNLPVSATSISGWNEEYAGKKLDFFRLSDPVTREKVHVFTLEVNSNGVFSAEAEVEQPTFVFSDFGIYRGMLFLEPGEKITLLLPPFRDKSFADQKNPYFQPVEFWFATGGGNQLNDRISAFDNQLYQLRDKYFNQLYLRESRQVFDSLSAVLEQQFGSISSKTFLFHKKLKIKAVEADAFKLEPASVSDELSEAPSAFWNHPAFTGLFDKMYGNKLSFAAKSIKGERIREAVSQTDTGFLLEFIKDNYKITGPVARLVLLKMLHDGFYSGDFSENAILNLVGADIFVKDQEKTVRETAKNILIKLRHLRPGSLAPVVCLKNTSGQRFCTNEISGDDKFKYLVFADTEMIVCREHLKYLAKIEDRFQKYLEIIIVLRKTDLIEMKMFLDKQKIPGIHLVDEEGRFTEEYRVKSFPTCLLLNDKHEVVFQQTKSPLDGFEQQFGRFLQRELFERQRKQ
ncbi:TlpA family protein disulfide reductase [Mariniphaga sediminis]|uniref:TlpA family protein disulfide reductase n=1 Tax=Mariniphaga sediminis TaxID=1628158 RepID=UPI0035622AFB